MILNFIITMLIIAVCIIGYILYIDYKDTQLDEDLESISHRGANRYN